MTEKKQADSEPIRKHGFLKAVKWVVLISAGLVLLIFIGVPIFLSSTGGTQFLLGKINSSVAGQVQMDDFSIGWLKGVKLTNLSYADDVGNTSVSVKRVETHPRYLSLLGGKVELGKTVIDSPQVYLKVPPKETTSSGAVSGVPEKEVEVSAKKTPSESSPPVFPVHEIDLELINGNATVELLGEVPQKVALTNIASNVQLDQGNRSGAVDVSMNLDDSSISANGEVKTDKSGWTIKDGNFDVEISKLQLGSLKPLLALAGQEMEVAGELNAAATVAIVDNKVEQLKADAVITNLAQGKGDQRIEFSQPVKMNALVKTSDKVIQIDAFKIQSQFCNVDCSGTTESLNFKADANLEQTQQLVSQFVDTGDLSMAGALTASGTVAMTEEKAAVNGKGNIAQLRIGKGAEKTPATDVQLDFDCTMDKAKEQLRIAYANLTTTPGTVKVSNLVMPMSKEAEKTLSMDARATMDMGQAWPFAKVFMEEPKITNMSGQVDAAFKVSTKGSEIRLLSENSQINNLRLDIPDSDPFLQEKIVLNCDVLVDSENKSIDIQKLELLGTQGESLIKVNKGNVAKKVNPSTTQVTGNFEAEYDLKAVSAMTSPFLPEGLSLEGKRNDTFKFESVYPTDNPELMVANLNAGGAVGFERMEYMGLNVGPTELQVNVIKGVMDLNIPETTVNDGKLQFGAKVDLNEKSKTLKLKKPTYVLENVHITEEMTKTMLARVNPLFNGQGNISGFVNLNCNDLQIPFSAEDRKNLFVDATVSIDDAQLQPRGATAILLRTNGGGPIPLQLLPTQILVQNEVVSYNNMEFHLGQYPTGFSGRMTLDGNVDMRVALPWRIDDDGLDLTPVHVGENLSRRLTVPCQGTAAEFSQCIRYDELLKQAVGDILQQQIRRGLRDIFN